MNHRSVADNFIEVMARLNAIEVNQGDPLWNVMRSLKNQGIEILQSAIRQAQELDNIAKQIQRDSKTRSAP